MNENRKPTVLLCWGYHRKGWIEVFEQLNNQFDFHYLYWIKREQEPANHTQCPIHYWSSYSSGREILATIKPTKVVFMGSNSLLAIGLIRACAAQKIPTYTMQHGLFHDLKTNLYLDEQMAKNVIALSENKKETRNLRHTLSFFLRSISLSDLPCFVPLAKWQLDQRKMLPLAALAKNKTRYRRTDYYIVYTKYNGQFFTECDGASESQMIEIGMPDFDFFFSRASQYVRPEGTLHYNLLIDSALTFNAELSTNGIVSQESYNAFINRLNNQSLRQRRRLYIKLHPYCYQNNKFIQHENIVYLRDANVVDLLLGADYVFGFDSTLMLASLYFRPTILFTIHEFSYLQKNIRHLNAAPVLTYNEFSDDELAAAFAFESTPVSREALTRHFLYKADGQSYKRLEKILLS